MSINFFATQNIYLDMLNRPVFMNISTIEWEKCKKFTLICAKFESIMFDNGEIKNYYMADKLYLNSILEHEGDIMRSEIKYE